MTRVLNRARFPFCQHVIATIVAIALVGFSGFATAQSLRDTTIADNRDLSALAVDWLQVQHGGQAEVSFSTSLGVRRVDLLTNGIANEVKVGNHSLTNAIQEQIRKDRELLTSGQVRGVVWHFMSNPTNADEQYISEPLVRALYASGFSVQYHGQWYTPEPVPSRTAYGSRAEEYDSGSSSGSGRECCRVCRAGQACGNSCISRAYTCRQPPGCACDG